MFDKFFNDHKPVNEEFSKADSAAVERINGLLKSKMAENAPSEKSIKKRKTLKRVLWVAAAAVVTAAALGVTAWANFTGGDKIIVRANNKRIDSKTYSYHEGRVKADVTVFDVPCEMLADKEGKPVTEDSDIDRRMISYNMTVYASDDPAEQMWDPEKGVAMLFSGDGWYELYLGDAVTIPVPKGAGGGNMLEEPAVLEIHYDEEQAEEFWKRYYENPEEEAEKLAECCAGYTKDTRPLSEILKDKFSGVFEHSDRMTEEEQEKLFEFIDENFPD